ncbi:helix-turn-helix domain-containing protein [Streptomyces somaliensis]|uniref:PucR family transcriptional regulator n=1 Tax=Streptomyces somaliensis TaxID=78355 RepID=UPI0020CF6933|nr:helix-turn-helix domain-containing protein [Streptomyces somaliensis]MCP9946906.1 helix-turn-helix domain-containing protein [Streptomyces somaliensis]
MHAERDARFRTTLLEEILSSADDLPAGTAAAAGRVGWRLAGLAHRRPHPAAAPPRAAPRGRATSSTPWPVPASPSARRPNAPAAGSVGPPPTAPRAATTGPPSWPGSPKRCASTTHAPGATPLVAGVGRPALGPAGLATTLAEARHAALATALADVPGGVQHVDRLGVTQVLMASCTSPSMRETAAGLLTPLLEDPAGPDLLRTLEAYFDCGCSASDTARRLGLHRNTVAQRLSRACTVLGVGLDTADERLALQLACRAHRLDAGPRRPPRSRPAPDPLPAGRGRSAPHRAKPPHRRGRARSGRCRAVRAARGQKA